MIFNDFHQCFFSLGPLGSLSAISDDAGLSDGATEHHTPPTPPATTPATRRAEGWGVLIIIMADNTNREQFIISSPLGPAECQRAAWPRPDTSAQQRLGGRGHWGGGGEGELMHFWWGLSRRGGVHDHHTRRLAVSLPPTPPVSPSWSHSLGSPQPSGREFSHDNSHAKLSISILK